VLLRIARPSRIAEIIACIRDLATFENFRYPLPTRGGANMTAKIQWRTEMDDALCLGQKAGKPVLLDFFNPN